MTRFALCHPERKHRAHGLCEECRRRKYYQDKRELLVAGMKRYYLSHKTEALARNRAWSKAHPSRKLEQVQRRRAALKGATIPGRTPTPAELAALVAPGVLCFYCKTRPATTVDHFVPLARGGFHVLENLRSACQPCNSAKGANLPHEWAGAA